MQQATIARRVRINYRHPTLVTIRLRALVLSFHMMRPRAQALYRPTTSRCLTWGSSGCGILVRCPRSRPSGILLLMISSPVGQLSGRAWLPTDQYGGMCYSAKFSRSNPSRSTNHGSYRLTMTGYTHDPRHHDRLQVGAKFGTASTLASNWSQRVPSGVGSVNSPVL